MPDAIRKVGEWLAHLWEWSTHDAVAFYTLWLAIFTGSLVWVSTVQIRYLRRADETARRSADAAKLAAETAHEEFVANHRPRIQILSFEESDIGAGADEEQIKLGASLRFVNSGDTTAYLLEIGWHISYADHPLRPGVTMRTHDCCNQALQSGEEGGYPLASDVPRKNTVVAVIRNMRLELRERQHLRCVGYVLYADANGRRRRTGFSRIHVADARRWDRDENPDYDYSY